MYFSQLEIGDRFYYADGRHLTQTPDVHVKVSATEHGHEMDGVVVKDGLARNYPVVKVN